MVTYNGSRRYFLNASAGRRHRDITPHSRDRQADKNGRYLHDDAPESSPLDRNFQYWAQLKTDDDGTYSVKTIKPGRYPAMADWVRPPHIHFKIARRGLKELTTQMYFANEPLNEIDKLYLATPKSERSSLVVAFENGRGQFDIVLENIA